jgi:AmpE protein
MKLLVIVLCLLSERFLIHSQSYQRFFWFNEYSSFIKKNIEQKKIFTNPWIILVLLIGPISIISLLLYIMLYSALFGIIGLIINIMIFYYCLGPSNPFYPLADTAIENNITVGNYLAEVNSQLFTVIFWYLIAGPIAVLVYRLFYLAQADESIHTNAKIIVSIIEWLPARMTVFLYLFVGNFQHGISRAMSFLLSNPHLNNTMLSQCGLLALRCNEAEDIPITAAEILVEYALILLLVIVALLALVWW